MTDDDSSVTRRRFLGALGAGGTLGALAGCLDGGGNGDDIGDSTTVFGTVFSHSTERAQLNPWGTQYPADFASLVFDPAVERTHAGRYEVGPLLDAVELDGSTVTVTYSDAYTWWNGDPVDARDAWVAHRIDEFVAPDGTPTATLVDDYTIRYSLDAPRARHLVLSNVVRGVDAPASVFRSWLERFEDASSTAARERVAADLRSFQLDLDTVRERGLGFGPYELVEVSPNRLLLERHDDHPNADALSIPRLWLPVAKASQANGLIGEGTLDGGQGLLADRGANPPDYIEQRARYRTTGGTKLVVNWRNEHLARRAVRRALFCALPIPTVVENAAWGSPPRRQTGLAAPAADDWLDDAIRASLRTYPVAADTERAATLLRDAGYTRDDGDWYGPNGRRLALRLDTLLDKAWGSSAQLIANSLRAFGVGVDVTQSPASSFLAVSRRDEYDLLLWWTTGTPYAAYDVTDPSPATLGYGVTDAATESALGRPVEPEVPTGDGGTETVDLLETWRRIERPTAEAETAAAARTFARWWNHALPDFYLATATSGVWGNARDFSWPAADDPAYRTAGSDGHALHALLRAGDIAPAER
ncbi:ABC transporter substrate-binding protein [Halarchaeum sp. P4]|uniref:ABC transporter substrate-binding protein n=1 Tax=Halarchaeum sp. P4 TaxID=3421639 RepID=UPI003EBFEE30